MSSSAILITIGPSIALALGMFALASVQQWYLNQARKP
jgi:hypothetical protein